MPEEMQKGYFDCDSYRPVAGEIERYLKHLKDSGQCWGCEGSCAIDWTPDGFKNHTLGGERSSSSPEPKILTMLCADAEIPVLCRQLRNGERTEFQIIFVINLLSFLLIIYYIVMFWKI
jgi:hypothetical protein